MQSYEENNDFGDQNCHLVSYDNEKVIDGKYYSCENINGIVYQIDDYQLVFACSSKKALIKKNLSKTKR